MTGKSFAVHRSGAVIVDLVAETVKKTGASWMGTLPGQGVVFHESGLLLHDFYDNVIRIAGPHDDPDVAFCEALA